MVDVAARPATAVGPYKGLAAFTDQDARFFFGRDRARRILAAHLQSARLTVVYGESGVGKSSLLRAGVVHDLRVQGRRDLDELGRVGFVVVEYATWQDDPVAGLAAAIATSLERTYGERPDVELDPEDRIEDWVKHISTALDVDLLFILDQFEELSLYHEADHPFMEQFPAAVDRQDLRANFLVSIREDRIAELDRLRARFRGDVLENRLKVEHLDVAAARLAITEPVEEHNRHAEQPVAVEPALVEAVIDQVKRGQVAIGDARATLDEARIETPYLQLVMSRLWEVETEAGSNVLRADTLESLGGAERIVRDHLDTALDGRAAAEQSAAADLFRYLVTPAGSKIALGAGDLAAFTGQEPARVQAVLRHLSEGGVRILRTVPPPPGGSDPRFEIFHDVLAPAVTEWRTRFDEQRNSVEARRQLEARVRASRRRAAFFGAVAIAAVVAATAIVLVIRNEQQQARDAQQAAETALADAERAQLETEYQLRVAESADADDPQDAIRSALAAVELDPGPEAEEALRRAVSANRLATITTGHDDVVWSVAYSRDGSRLVTASRDGTAAIVDAASGVVTATLVGHEDEVGVAAFTPAGDRVVTAGADGTARVWSADDGTLLATLEHDEAGADPGLLPVVRLATTEVLGRDGAYVATGPFSADGSLVVTSQGSTARVWDLDSGELVDELFHPAQVNSAAFTPDGSQIVTAGSDGVVRVWGLDGEVAESYGEAGVTPWVTVATSDPTGTRILAGHSDGSVSLWSRGVDEPLMQAGWHSEDVRVIGFSIDGTRFFSVGGRTMRAFVTDTQFNDSLYSGSSWINDAGFSPDGRAVVVAETNGTASVVWSSYDKPVLTLIGHDNVVWGATFSPDGARIATASEDTTMRTWTVPGGLVIATDVVTIHTATFDPTATRVLTASFDGNATIHDIATGEAELVLYGDVFPGGGNVYYPMYSADFDDDGERIVTAQDSGVVELWDAATGEELGACCSVGWIPWGAAFMPGGDRIAAIYFDNTARVWDAVGSGWDEAHVFEETLSLAYSEDGTRLATVDRDGTTRVWDAATYEALRAWDTGLVNSLALSGDGATLVTAGVDGGITVWDVATGATLVTIPDADAGSLALGADDGVIVSGGSDGSASVWQLADGSFLGSVVAHADSITTVEMAPDGQIATTSFDGTARVFECEVCSASLDEVVAMAEAALVEPAG